MDSLVRPLVVTMLSITLAGCPVPLPPGYEGGSRQNVPGVIPAFIRPEDTTRADVMMHLGEPDAIADNESWISYGSAYGYGGMALIMAAGNTAGGIVVGGTRYRRLIVPFDAQGVALQPIFESKDCMASAFFAGNAAAITEPCLDIWGSDLPKRFGMSPPRP
ncbi:MAG: hypothetical protein FIB06_03725 [Betaproteobacteria bacterium]|nr:hypothetical protein [Betaproteobacteria bacterium]